MSEVVDNPILQIGDYMYHKEGKSKTLCQVLDYASENRECIDNQYSGVRLMYIVVYVNGELGAHYNYMRQDQVLGLLDDLRYYSEEQKDCSGSLSNYWPLQDWFRKITHDQENN
jgi:hypothetical protein